MKKKMKICSTKNSRTSRKLWVELRKIKTQKKIREKQWFDVKTVVELRKFNTQKAQKNKILSTEKKVFDVTLERGTQTENENLNKRVGDDLRKVKTMDDISSSRAEGKWKPRKNYRGKQLKISKSWEDIPKSKKYAVRT